MHQMEEIIVPDPDHRAGLTAARQKGEFWKPCPGTTGGYLCCGYQIITPMTGCAMYCRYCVLQAYFDDQKRVRFTNIDDLKREITEKMSRWHGVVRFGTGEFADSLHAEEQTGSAVAVAKLLEPYNNAVVEFKTKSAVVNPLAAIPHPEKVIIAFSLNSERMVALMERNTASLDERFSAARRVLAMGFSIAFHFDPIFYYDGWEDEYAAVIDRIYATVADHAKIAWVSMGGFRSNPALKQYLRDRKLHLPLFSGEMITGADGKIRYFRPIRVALYKGMQKAFFRHDPQAPLYLCMESSEVWEGSGMAKKIPHGLPAFLDSRAQALLDRIKVRA